MGRGVALNDMITRMGQQRFRAAAVAPSHGGQGPPGRAEAVTSNERGTRS
ncbi:MAG: hypothetical protein AVDCRST_MAG64-2820 [uncultured Phycisphaerae bacterium]|uniref:Uncharacterized protein n=1 Tax=uncultured Phycisphaerae bacterium TaxID=904963 RepID=A0A6J4PRU4_9BACT|nr:MAG: hypothetical protein AVDCRST_MAG64-2820 [uncultured Phycisphaerae bacterium]